MDSPLLYLIYIGFSFNFCVQTFNGQFELIFKSCFWSLNQTNAGAIYLFTPFELNYYAEQHESLEMLEETVVSWKPGGVAIMLTHASRGNRVTSAGHQMVGWTTGDRRQVVHTGGGLRAISTKLFLHAR